MANVYNFSSDNIHIIILIVDASGSMENDTDNVIAGLRMYKKEFENFPGAKSIAVSVCRFATDFHRGDFRYVQEMDTSYYADGWTALYYSIVKGKEYLINYMEDVARINNCTPTAEFIVISDGQPEHDKMSEDAAKEAINALNYMGVQTAFAACGEAINSNFGTRLGFMSTKDITDKSALVKFFGEELSKASKEQSKRYEPMGSNFFSQAANGNSEGYSHTAAQALEDDSWINDI